MNFNLANDEWQVPNDNDCWYDCGSKGGKCDWCGTVGYCCSSQKDDINGDCTVEMQNAILMSPFINETSRHICVVKHEGKSTKKIR